MRAHPLPARCGCGTASGCPWFPTPGAVVVVVVVLAAVVLAALHLTVPAALALLAGAARVAERLCRAQGAPRAARPA